MKKEKNRKIMTLIIIHKHPRFLLGKKKKGFGMDKWNGFGGKVEDGETIEEAARRELFEEAGIIADDLEKIGVNEFEWQNGDELIEVHIFKVKNFKGNPRESDEMSPIRWFFADEIPFNEMWQDDRYWFPYFMRSKKFRGYFIFNAEDKIVDYSLAEWRE